MLDSLLEMSLGAALFMSVCVVCITMIAMRFMGRPEEVVIQFPDASPDPVEHDTTMHVDAKPMRSAVKKAASKH